MVESLDLDLIIRDRSFLVIRRKVREIVLLLPIGSRGDERSADFSKLKPIESGPDDGICQGFGKAFTCPFDFSLGRRR